MYGYIYKTTNLITGKTYIGKKTGQFDQNYYGSGIVLQQALKKYGRENFMVAILGTYDTEEDLNRAEIMLIESLEPPYNIAKGGNGGDTLARASKEHKQDVVLRRAATMSAVHKNLSAEKRLAWNQAISDAKKGRTPNRPNYHHSEAVKQRLQITSKVAYANRSPEWEERLRLGNAKRRGIANVTSRTPVEIQGIIYPGIGIAANELGVTVQTVHNWIHKGKAKHV